jgi:hypothetical protein
MHLREGFVLAPPPTSAASLAVVMTAVDLEQKKRVWEQWDSQLFATPSGVTLYDRKASSTAGQPRVPSDLPPGALGMDRRMVDPENLYNRRTGMAAQPAVEKMEYGVKVQGAGKGAKLEVIPAPNQNSRAEAEDPNTIKDHPNFKDRKAIIDRATGKLAIVEKKQTLLPATPASNRHSMFEDGESAIMYLTAALLSQAGQRVLECLRGRPQDVSLAIWSKTACRAVTAAVAAVPQNRKPASHPRRTETVKMIDRVNTYNANRELTGTFVLTQKEIRYATTTLSVWPAEELMIVSHYPCSDDMANIELQNGVMVGDRDLAEINPGQFAGYAVENPPPALPW